MTNNDEEIDDIRSELRKIRCERDEAKMMSRLLSKEHEKRVAHIKSSIESVFKKMNALRMDEYYTDVSEKPPRSVLTYQTLLLSQGFRADAQERYIALVQRQNKEMAKNVLCSKFKLEDEKLDLQDKYAEQFRIYGQLSSLMKTQYLRKTRAQRVILRSLKERLGLYTGSKTKDPSWKRLPLLKQLMESSLQESMLDLNMLEPEMPGLRKAIVSPSNEEMISASTSSKLATVQEAPQNPLQRLAQLQRQVEARGREIQKRTEARGRQIVETQASTIAVLATTSHSTNTNERRLSDPDFGKQCAPADQRRFKREESMRRKTLSGDELDIPDSVLNMSFSILDNPDLMFTPIQHHIKLAQ